MCSFFGSTWQDSRKESAAISCKDSGGKPSRPIRPQCFANMPHAMLAATLHEPNLYLWGKQLEYSWILTQIQAWCLMKEYRNQRCNAAYGLWKFSWLGEGFHGSWSNSSWLILDFPVKMIVGCIFVAVSCASSSETLDEVGIFRHLQAFASGHLRSWNILGCTPTLLAFQRILLCPTLSSINKNCFPSPTGFWSQISRVSPRPTFLNTLCFWHFSRREPFSLFLNKKTFFWLF